MHDIKYPILFKSSVSDLVPGLIVLAVTQEQFVLGANSEAEAAVLPVHHHGGCFPLPFVHAFSKVVMPHKLLVNFMPSD